MRRRRSAIRIAGPRVRIGPRGVRVRLPRVRVGRVRGARILRRAVRGPVVPGPRPHVPRRGCLGLLPGCLVPIFLIALATTTHRLATRPR